MGQFSFSIIGPKYLDSAACDDFQIAEDLALAQKVFNQKDLRKIAQDQELVQILDKIVAVVKEFDKVVHLCPF